MPIQHDVPMTDYLALNALSSGQAFRAVADSPLHALAYKLQPRDPSTASNKGEIIHRILLEGHENAIVAVEAENWRTKAAQEERDAAYADNKVPILSHEMGGIKAAVISAQRFIEQSELAGIFGTGNAEVTVTWEDGDLPCKARPDYLTDNFHVSVKTTNVVGGANPSTWSRRQLSPMGYDFALQFYRRGLIANGLDVQHRFLIIEQQFPYGCSVVGLAPSKSAIADADVERAIKLWAECF
jgi:hypothetical protein